MKKDFKRTVEGDGGKGKGREGGKKRMARRGEKTIEVGEEIRQESRRGQGGNERPRACCMSGNLISRCRA